MKKIILIIILLLNSIISFESSEFSILYNKFELKKLYVLKSGSYFGLIQGKYQAFEFGQELQWKKIKILKPTTNSGNFGFNYDYKEKVIGFNLGYWRKKGRLNLTYGFNAVFRSNFEENVYGGGPVIGFKLLGFHLNTGYNFLTKTTNFKNTNNLFISLRYVFINSRDYKLK